MSSTLGGTFLCRMTPDKRRNRKLAHYEFSEGLAFLFAFQIESFPVAAGALRSPAGRLLDVQPWAEAHGGIPRHVCSDLLRGRRGPRGMGFPRPKPPPPP